MTLSTSQSAPAKAPKVRVLHDVVYVSGRAASPRQRLDLYLPEGAKGALPVFIAVPGGGLVEGDKASSAQLGQRFAQAGFVTAVINHRLSPEVAHPGHVEDLAAALAWVQRTIADHGGDPQRIFLSGHSAGAYLATLLVTEPRYLAAHGLAVESVRAVVAVSGFYWVERVAPQRDRSIWGEAHAAWLSASPSRHLHAKLPPALFVHADGDDEARRAENIDIADAARAAGSRHAESLEILDRDHRTLWTRIADADDPLAQRILAFLRAHGA